MEVFAQDKLYDEAVALARRMQDTSPTAFAITKRITNQTFDNNAASIMEMESAGQAVCLANQLSRRRC
jgi:enoyl-CoA hydratase/carnithine racemase